MPSGASEAASGGPVFSPALFAVLEAYLHQLKKKTYAISEIFLIGRGDSSNIAKKELWAELDMM